MGCLQQSNLSDGFPFIGSLTVPLQISFLKKYHYQIYCSFKEGAEVFCLQNVWTGPWVSVGWLANVPLGDITYSLWCLPVRAGFISCSSSFPDMECCFGYHFAPFYLNVLQGLPWPHFSAFCSCLLPILDPALSFSTCKWESESWPMMEEQDLSYGHPLLNTRRFWDHLFPLGLHSHCINNAKVLMNSLAA